MSAYTKGGHGVAVEAAPMRKSRALTIVVPGRTRVVAYFRSNEDADAFEAALAKLLEPWLRTQSAELHELVTVSQ